MNQPSLPQDRDTMEKTKTSLHVLHGWSNFHTMSTMLLIQDYKFPISAKKKKTCSQLSQFEITSKFTTECRTRDMSCLLSSRWRNSWHGSLKKKLARQFLSFYCIFGQTSSVPKFIIKSLRPLPKCYWNIRTKNSYRRIVEGKGFFFLKFFVVFPRR